MTAFRWTYGFRFLSGQIRRATWRNTLMYRVRDDLQIGVEYNPLASDVGPLLNYRAVDETRRRPSLTFGTSSDRIGTPHGHAYYAVLAKDLEPLTGWPVAPYFSALYGTFQEEFVFPLGARIRIARGWSALPSYDGHAFHPMLEYAFQRYTVTGIMIRSRDPGVALTVGF